MEKQGYAPVVDNPPEHHAGHADDVDDLVEVHLGQSVSRHVRVLWMQRRIMLRFFWWGLVISFILAFIIPKRYESTVRLMPPENPSTSALGMMAAMSSSGGGGGSGGGGSLGLAASLLGAKGPGELFKGILVSRSVQDAVIDRFQLLKEYDVSRYQDARQVLSRNTDITEDRKSGIISITVTASSPDRAQAMAGGYVEVLAKVVNRVYTGSARKERVFLEERLAAIKRDLDQSAQSFSSFASKNTALDIPEQAKASLMASARLQGELAAAESQLKGLEQVYTDNNVRVRSLRGQIAELKRQTQTTDKGDGTGAGEDSLGQMIRSLPKLGVTYAQLYRTFAINEAVFEALSKQYEIAKVQEAKEIPPVNVLDPANYPEKKSWPKRSLVILFGVFFSVALSAAWILGNDYWENLDPAHPVKIYAGDKWNRYAARLRRKRIFTTIPRSGGETPGIAGDPSGNGDA